MLQKLRFRLTAVCTLSTVVILAAMAYASFHITETELSARGRASFYSDLNTILYHIRSQTVLDHTWLSQTEAESGLMLYLEDCGKPMLFSGSANGFFLELREGGGSSSRFYPLENLRAERKKLLLDAKRAAAGAHGLDISKKPARSLHAQTAFFSLTGADGTPYYAAAAAVPLSDDGWVGLTVVKSRRPELARVARLRLDFSLLVGVAALLLTAFAWLFTGWAVRPVAESRRRQMQFVSAASHELRSPLAVVQTAVAAMRSAPPDQAERFERGVLSECARMSRLIDDLLALASADSGSWPMRPEPVELDTLLLETAERFEPIAAQKGISIGVTLPEDPLPRCRCDRQRIGQVLAVLADNAVGYTPPGGRVVFSASACRRGVRLCVADNGPGVPDAEKARVFERFYRSDAARSEKAHYGLGLCVAREIVRLHNGRLTVEDTPGGGATFACLLPAGKK